MVLWQLYAIVGVVCIILEMIVPSMFFLNLAIAGFITAVISLFINNADMLTIDFIILSLVSLFVLRPLLLRTLKSSKDKETGISGDYIGKIVKVIEPVTKYSGAITIYDERWDARIEDEGEIPAGSEVRIIRNESLVMYVERV
ncbi:TPA: NfeD family protein [Candidatus Scatousia excrementigallinarum]|uniref:NfeD family protein n=1 Tax=Candidatus Scatousia excrementigallinarum TaxID=2840935 RepID=A0A9D1F0V1_9BACT|nr:NfeD family protein [Candidatus Scatousia excrementigallinarum]